MFVMAKDTYFTRMERLPMVLLVVLTVALIQMGGRMYVLDLLDWFVKMVPVSVKIHAVMPLLASLGKTVVVVNRRVKMQRLRALSVVKAVQGCKHVMVHSSILWTNRAVLQVIHVKMPLFPK
jgi:hypothetical protein